MLANKLSGSAGADKLWVDDCFACHTYTGNGSTQTINNGIDLENKGGMVWLKSRNNATNHEMIDTIRGGSSRLIPNAYFNSLSDIGANQFTSNGFIVTHDPDSNANYSASNIVSWTFRKAPKFFDMVTFVGDGGADRQIPHSLGQAPGLIIVKRTNDVSQWFVYHRSIGQTNYVMLNSTAAQATNPMWGTTPHNASTFTVGNGDTNVSGGINFVAYLFAHDTSTAGIIQCGTYTETGSTVSVNLGWEPQYILIKASSSVDNWRIFDSSRGLSQTSVPFLMPNQYAAENAGFADPKPTATGFTVGTLASGSATMVYLAIRRPNKPPTVGTQVYQAIARTGTGAAATVTGVGFAPDLVALHSRSGTTGGRWEDRLRGATIELVPETPAAETTVAQSITSFGMDGFALGTDGDWNTNTATYIHHCFKRAPGVMDQVCYTGTGVAKTEAHNLGVVPELIIFKRRSVAGDWVVSINTTSSAVTYMSLNTTAAQQTDGAGLMNSTLPTASVFSLGASSASNQNTTTHVCYLFATKAGISKVGSYTGNATTNAINCGFTTGARFVLIKRTDSTGDWYVWDTVRGIIAGNDPYLLLNSTAAEVTSTDYIDPVSTGFELSSTAPAAINASGGSFIYLAFA